ncbi:hypothetical protein ABZX98_21980 [Streptomyces sp. NPDC002992]|uniref:hypothetical protein n=1 Tax=Streptomyces sp. NPDC002992 TaxID=3154273 RepID=UPI0033ABF6AE
MPERALARERREDARLTDERDERERRQFDVITLVDIDIDIDIDKDQAPSFGVEFARVATIRTIHLGTSAAPGSTQQHARGQPGAT